MICRICEIEFLSVDEADSCDACAHVRELIRLRAVPHIKEEKPTEDKAIEGGKVCRNCGISFYPILGKMIYCIDCKAKIKKVRSKFYGTSWMKIRFQVLNRDNFTCQYCGRKAPDVVLEVDHINPTSNNGMADMNNLVTACHECNIGKGDALINYRKSLIA